MKKIIYVLLLLIQTTAYGCNLCFDYPKKKKFRKETMVAVECNCNCFQQPRSSHDEKYKCLACGHRVLPYDIKTVKIVAPQINKNIH